MRSHKAKKMAAVTLMEASVFLAALIAFVPFISWVLLAIITGVGAYHRGHDVVGWALLSLILLGPFALLWVLVTGRNEETLETRALAKGKMKRCFTCAELVKFKAAVCRYCGAKFAKFNEG